MIITRAILRSLARVDVVASSASNLAGVPGFEPGPQVLETCVLAADTIPLCTGSRYVS